MKKDVKERLDKIIIDFNIEMEIRKTVIKQTEKLFLSSSNDKKLYFQNELHKAYDTLQETLIKFILLVSSYNLGEYVQVNTQIEVLENIEYFKKNTNIKYLEMLLWNK